jgi:hypothetical protein
MSAARRDAASHRFFTVALEYYVTGRGAARSWCIQIAGNLFHHAVEMLIKGQLARSLSLDDLKKQFGHSLPKCWAAFKGQFPGEDLSEFDPMIAALDKFETIRYPDKVVDLGAAINIGFGRGQPGTTYSMQNPVPDYQMGIGDVDAFFGRLFPLCRMNPAAYLGFLSEYGKESLLKFNDDGAAWLK